MIMDTKTKKGAWLKVMPAIALTICLLAAHTSCTNNATKENKVDEFSILEKEKTTADTTIFDGKSASISAEKDIDVAEKIFTVVETNPEYPGGNAAMMKFLYENLHYPAVAQENGIQGRVTLQFVVTSNGEIRGTKILKGVDPSLDKEAIRVIQSMPKWTPGKQDGKPVNVWITLPITFKVN
jgi:protein TonB